MSQPQDATRSGVKTMVLGLLKDFRLLIHQEVALARHEIQYEIGKILKAVMWCGIAVVLAVTGVFVIAAACVLILFQYSGLPAWACAVIVSVLLLGGAWGLAMAGWGVARSVRLVPARTVRTIFDDAKWMAEWMRTRFT